MIEAEVIEGSQEVVLREIKYPLSKTNLSDLINEYKDIPEIDPEAADEIVSTQYAYVLKGHKAFVKARTGIEKTRKILKQPAMDYGRKVDDIAKEFQSLIKSTEQSLFIQRKKVEDNEARKQQEAEELEEKRVFECNNIISSFKNAPLECVGKTAIEISKIIESIQAPKKEQLEEFYEEALITYSQTLTQVTQMYDNQLLVDDAKRLQEERENAARLERLEEEEKQKAVRDQLAADQEAFNKQKADFEAQMRAVEEEKNIAEAIAMVDELQAEQDAQKIERAKKEEIDREIKIAITLESMNKYTDNGLLLNEIINGAVPNLRWGAE